MKMVIVTYHEEIDKSFLRMIESLGVCDYLFHPKVLAYDCDGRQWGEQHAMGKDSMLIVILEDAGAEEFYDRMIHYKSEYESRKHMRILMLPVEKYDC